MRRSKLAASLFALAATALLLGLAAVPASARLVMFSSPSHNIGCAMTTRYARCDIQGHTWKAPRKPANCPLDWGNGLSVGTRGRAGFVCAGDTTLDPRGRVLAYGTQQIMGRYTCSSRRSGMTCSNRGTGHGFRIARGSYRVF
jgi:hypothetical protein